MVTEMLGFNILLSDSSENKDTQILLVRPKVNIAWYPSVWQWLIANTCGTVWKPSSDSYLWYMLSYFTTKIQVRCGK